MSVLRRIITAILALALLLTLAGCQCDHQWAEADCLNPRTCTKCGETEGEPLGHDWQKATCQAPETCAVCGLTQGETLGHSWKEADYQDPETCTTCGATQGEPVEADFEKYGLEINLWENRHYSKNFKENGRFGSFEPLDGFPYVETCPKDESKKTTAALYLCNYRIFQSDETHQAVDGYEWRAFDVEIGFSDENAKEYGAQFTFALDDYYAGVTHSGTVDPNDYDMSDSSAAESQWDYLTEIADYAKVGEISFHGETYSIAQSIENSGWGQIPSSWIYCASYSASIYACVPIGYDGVIVAFLDRGIIQDGVPTYEYADENTLFFRMDDQVLDLDW